MESAARFLADVPLDEAFRTCNGVVIRNLSELKNYLEGCSEYDFRYHVNADHFKNDFAIWVHEVVRDEALAHELDGVLDRSWYVHKVAQRLRDLNSS